MKNKLPAYWTFFERIVFSLFIAGLPWLQSKVFRYEIEGWMLALAFVCEIVAIATLFFPIKALIESRFSLYGAGEMLWKSELERSKKRKSKIEANVGASKLPMITVIICIFLIAVGIGIAFAGEYIFGTGLAIVTFRYISKEIKFGS